MKLFLIPVGMLVAGILGYSLEPQMRIYLTGNAPGSAEMADSKPFLLQMPDGKRVELTSVPADQLPKVITLKNDFNLQDKATGLAVHIAVGSEVNLVRIEGANAVINQGKSGFQVKIPVVDTDLLERLSETLSTGNASQSVTNVPAAPSTAAPAAPEPAPTPAPETANPPMETPTASEPAAVVDNGPVDAVKLMQDSIKGAEIKEFTFDAVTEWKAEEDETVDGETYKIGSATYKAETILGVKMMQAKALIKGGKIVRWIRPKTGTEIK
jgi:hypothetical protein